MALTLKDAIRRVAEVNYDQEFSVSRDELAEMIGFVLPVRHCLSDSWLTDQHQCDGQAQIVGTIYH